MSVDGAACHMNINAAEQSTTAMPVYVDDKCSQCRACSVLGWKEGTAIQVHGHMVLSQDRGNQYKPQKYYDPYHKDHHKGTPDFGKLLYA